MPTHASNNRQPANPTSRGKGSFTSAQAKTAPTTKTPPIHPSSTFFSGILTLGHARRGDGRTKVFDADFYVGADNCHAMTGVLFFYDKNNKYGQLGYDDLYFYNVWGRIARYDPAAGVNLFYAAGYGQGTIDVVGDIEKLEFIGVRDPEADYHGGPLSFSYCQPAKFSITGAAWQCDATNNTFCIDTEPYISSLAKATSGSKASMPFLFYFDPQGRFGKSEKKPMPRDNKVVTIEGCITNVTWGSQTTLLSITLTLPIFSATPVRGAGRFQSKGKLPAVLSASQPSTPIVPAPPTPATGLHSPAQLPHAPPAPTAEHVMFNPGVDTNFTQWMKAIPPAMLQQLMATQGQPQTPTFQFTAPPHQGVPQAVSLTPTSHLLQPPAVDSQASINNPTHSQSMFGLPAGACTPNTAQNPLVGSQTSFGNPTHPQSVFSLPPGAHTPNTAQNSPPAHPQSIFNLPPGARIPNTAQHPPPAHIIARPSPTFPPQQPDSGPSGTVLHTIPPAPSPPTRAAILSTPSPTTTVQSNSASGPSTPIVPAHQPPHAGPLTVSPQQLLQLTAGWQLQSGRGTQGRGAQAKPNTRKRGLPEHDGDEGRGKQAKAGSKE